MAKYKAFAVSFLVVLIGVFVLAGSVVVYAQESKQGNEEQQTCFSLLQKEVKKQFGLGFPYTYDDFAKQASVHSSRQNMISRIAASPVFKYYSLDFGAQTVWTPNSPFFADTWPASKEYSLIFYYENTTFDGCAFTKVSPIGNYTHDTMFYKYLNPESGSSRISNVSEINMVQDGFKFSVARYVRDFVDYNGNEFVRYRRISLASNLTTAKEEQVWAAKVLLYAEVADLREENRALRGKLDASGKKQSLAPETIYWAIIAVLAIALLALILKNTAGKKSGQ